MVNINKQDLISNIRLNEFVQTLANSLEVNAPLTFLNRTPIVNVFDDTEIINSWSSTDFAADLISNDAVAVVHEAGRLETTARVFGVPNIKHGISIGQGMLARLIQLKDNVKLSGADNDLFTGYELQTARQLISGVRKRMNQLCAAMMLDGVEYDRMGFKISAGFGTPTELKQTLIGNRQWTQANLTTMRPIEDLQFMAQSVAPGLGKNFNRVTMPTALFQLIIASTEFAERVRFYTGIDPDNFLLNQYDVTNMQTLFERVTGLFLELEDTTFQTQGTTGAITNTRVLPSNKVIMSNTADDNNPEAYYFANSIVEESIVSQLAPNAPSLGGAQVGPTAYYWADPAMNPPRINAFAVAKGWPVKKDKYSTAIFTVA